MSQKAKRGQQTSIEEMDPSIDAGYFGVGLSSTIPPLDLALRGFAYCLLSLSPYRRAGSGGGRL